MRSENIAVGIDILTQTLRRGGRIVFVGAGVYLIVALGIGLFVSTVTRTQQQTMFVSFFILMVYLLMSGMFTPLESMPRAPQAPRSGFRVPGWPGSRRSTASGMTPSSR